jgi:TolA-binding protein
MKTYRTVTTIGGLILAASLALAQIAPPAPPAPPAPAPMPAPAPVAAPMPPMPPMPAIAPDVAIQMAQDAMDQVAPVLANVDVQMADVRAQLDNLNFDFDFQFPMDWPDLQIQIQDDVQAKIDGKIQDKMAKASEKMAEANAKMAQKFNFDALGKSLAFQQGRAIYVGPRGSDDSMYQNGLRAIDNHQYDQALSEFNNVVSHAGVRAEGALYWKAYVLNKLGRSADAQASIDTLRKTYPSSRWLDDAKVLELEVKQSKGPVSPDAETDDDIKVLALNGLMQSDPEKALPEVEKLLKGTHSPNLKRQALYVIAQNNTPKAQQMLEQIARGGNPDLQVRAIQFMSERRNPDTPKILLEIYSSTTDPAVKRAVLDTFTNNRDKDRLLQVLKVERDGNLRSRAIERLGDVDGQPELWQIYQSETTTDGKVAVLNAMAHNGNLDKLAEVARTDKEPKVRQKAIEIISEQDAGSPMTVLTSLYTSEQDEKVKQTIIDHLSNRRGDCKPLVDVARSEKDIHMKLRLVERLSNMARSCQAASDYLTELLSR